MDHISSIAAFYCYCLFKMTGIQCKYFYIRYVKIKDEKMLFNTFKFKYQDGYDGTKDSFDFEEKLTNLKKKTFIVTIPIWHPSL